MGRSSSLGPGFSLVIFSILSFDLAVGDFGGVFVEGSWTGHGDIATPVDLNKLSDLSGTFIELLGHFAVVVGDDPRSLKDDLELSLRRVNVVVRDFFHGLFAGSPHGDFHPGNYSEEVAFLI